jgi:DNA-binding CsgD family transcriptional regulator
MSSAAVAYKRDGLAQAETVMPGAALWDHIQTATRFLESHPGRSGQASAVVVRPSGGDPVVIVLVDRQAGVLPEPAELCARFGLTRREAEVALLLAERMSCREIAERLTISFSTARYHTMKILDKLAVRSKHAIRGRISQ